MRVTQRAFSSPQTKVATKTPPESRPSSSKMFRKTLRSPEPRKQLSSGQRGLDGHVQDKGKRDEIPTEVSARCTQVRHTCGFVRVGSWGSRPQRTTEVQSMEVVRLVAQNALVPPWGGVVPKSKMVERFKFFSDGRWEDFLLLSCDSAMAAVQALEQRRRRDPPPRRTSSRTRTQFDSDGRIVRISTGP